MRHQVPAAPKPQQGRGDKFSLRDKCLVAHGHSRAEGGLPGMEYICERDCFISRHL